MCACTSGGHGRKGVLQSPSTTAFSSFCSVRGVFSANAPGTFTGNAAVSLEDLFLWSYYYHYICVHYMYTYYIVCDWESIVLSVILSQLRFIRDGPCTTQCEL